MYGKDLSIFKLPSVHVDLCHTQNPHALLQFILNVGLLCDL